MPCPGDPVVTFLLGCAAGAVFSFKKRLIPRVRTLRHLSSSTPTPRATLYLIRNRIYN